MDSDSVAFTGRFSDGDSAVSVTVHGRMRDRDIVFWPAGTESPDRPSDGTSERTWRYDALTTNESVRRGDPDVLIHHTATPGATLFVEDQRFVSLLADKAEHTSPSAWFWRFTKPALAILAVLLSITGAVYAFDLSPSRALATMMPQTMREEIGNSLFTSLTKDKYKTCSTAAGDAALAKMVARLRRKGDPPYETSVIDWGLENAFALPGGRIVLTRGLIKGAANAEEVTGVLAHEIGHIVELHPEAGIVRALGLTVAAQFIFTGGSETVGNIGTLLVALRFNRGAEEEADNVGLEILKDASVDPKPLAGFFERMLNKHGLNIETAPKPDTTDEKEKSNTDEYLKRGVNKSLEMFSTHPHSAGRIRKIKASATYAGTSVLTDAEWKALQAICKSS